jgi:type II secretory pathway component GspD/PulD (secretin)
VRAERGEKFGDYIARYCDLGAGAVEKLPKADVTEIRNLREPDPAKAKGQPIDISDWIVVTGSREEIERVDRFYGLYYASVPQIEIEARIAEISSTDTLDLGALFNMQRSPTADPVAVESFSGTFPNQSSATTGILGALDLSTVQNKNEFDATLHFLQTQQGVDLISNPRIAVRNGGRAEIVTGTEIPYLEFQSIQSGNIVSGIKYRVVGVKLYVVPYVAGPDAVSLEVDVEVSAQTGLSNLGGDPAILSPVISTRSAKTLVQVKDGDTFVIGGLLATNEVETENRVPVLGSIPLLGLLFRSTFTQKQTSEVLFFLTPRLIAEEAGPAGLIFPK